MGVQFFKNIFIALFHLSKGLDHYENLKRIFPIFSLLFLFFSQISQESRGVKTMNRKLKQPGLIYNINKICERITVRKDCLMVSRGVTRDRPEVCRCRRCSGTGGLLPTEFHCNKIV